MSETNIFECATCIGIATLPYWGPPVLALLVATAFFLFVYRKPMPREWQEEARDRFSNQ